MHTHHSPAHFRGSLLLPTFGTPRPLTFSPPLHAGTTLPIPLTCYLFLFPNLCTPRLLTRSLSRLSFLLGHSSSFLNGAGRTAPFFSFPFPRFASLQRRFCAPLTPFTDISSVARWITATASDRATSSTGRCLLALSRHTPHAALPPAYPLDQQAPTLNHAGGSPPRCSANSCLCRLLFIWDDLPSAPAAAPDNLLPFYRAKPFGENVT